MPWRVWLGIFKHDGKKSIETSRNQFVAIFMSLISEKKGKKGQEQEFSDSCHGFGEW